MLGPQIYQLTRAGQSIASDTTGDLDVEDALEIVGAGANATTILQLTDDRVIATINAESLTLRDLRIDGGNSVAEGAAIHADWARLHIEDVVFRNNVASERGGAIWQSVATPADGPPQLVLRRVTFDGNQAMNNVGTRGGALHVELAGSGAQHVRIEDCVFRDNSASDAGGAIHFVSSPGEVRRVDIVGSSFVDNLVWASAASGAAIAVSIDAPGDIALHIDDTVFETNIAAQDDSTGGAIALGDGSLAITRSRFFSNTAGRGGALSIGNSATATIHTSTLCDNSADAAGGAIRNAGALVVDTSTLCRNTVTATSPAFPGGGAISSGGNLELRNSTLDDNSATHGGAITVTAGSVRLHHATLRAPDALPPDAEAGLLRYQPASGANLELLNTILIGRCGYANAGTVPAIAVNNIEASGTTCRLALATTQVANQTAVAGDAVALGPLQANGGPTDTRMPATDSIAIDAGNWLGRLTLDQRGHVRSDDDCDIGAVEAGALPPPTAVFADGFESPP